MTCEGYQEQVSQLIDNELGERESQLLFGHLRDCAECRGFLHTTLRLRSGLQEHGPLLAPTHLNEKVLGTAPAKSPLVPDKLAIPSVLWKRRVSLPVPIAAAVVVLLMLGSIALSSLWLRGPEPQFQPQTVYVTTLPTVEVQGIYSQPQTTLQ